MKRIEINVITGEALEFDVSPDEAAEIAIKEQADTARAPFRAIQNIEEKNPITHRALREFFLAFGELYPASKATQLYLRVKAADDAIRAERAKL